MRLVYVFDCTDDAPDSYLVRCPEFLARVIVKWSQRPLDYWETPSGL